MASGVEELLDMLFEMIDEAKNAPFSGGDKCVIERDRALDLIDDIRSQFPMELTEAKKMMASRNEWLSNAKREAENIRKAAEDKARQLLAEDVITLQAKQRANDMVQQAEERSRELKRSANEYCEDACAARKRLWLRLMTRSKSPAPGSVPRPVPPLLQRRQRETAAPSMMRLPTKTKGNTRAEVWCGCFFRVTSAASCFHARPSDPVRRPAVLRHLPWSTDRPAPQNRYPPSAGFPKN